MAIEPINYMGAMPQEDFLRDIQGGLQLGQVFQQRRLQNEQRQMAVDAAKQYQSDLQAAMANPSPQSFASLALKYPQQREAVKQAWDGLSEADRKQEGDTMAQAYSALLAGRNDIAQSVVQKSIEARKNAGLDTSHYDNALSLLKDNPQQAQAALGFTLSHINDPKAFATQFGALGKEGRETALAPAEQAKAEADAQGAQADAQTKGVQAKYADQKALLDLEGIRTDIQFKRDQTKIGYLNAKISSETNALKRQEMQLELQKAQQELADKARAKVADAEGAASNTDNMLNTVDRLLQNPSLKDVVGSIEGRLPSVFSDKGADAIALIDTLGSQAFLSQVPAMKGQGALSDAEGKKLQAALANLSRTQSEEQFTANLKEIKRIGMKARANISKRYGVPLGNPDTPANAAARPPLSSFGG